MAYTVTQLITGAYYESSIVARQFEAVQGYQLNDALEWLNQILQDKTANTGEIPYITTWMNFNASVGVEKYYIPNLVDIQSIVFFIDSVRYEMKYVGRRKYFGTPRANNINALPLSFTYERAFGGVNLFLYFFPDKPYQMQIVGNMFMNPVTLNQDLTQCIANLGTVTVPGNSLGAVTILGTGVLAPTQLVINGVDLAGTYTSAAALANYINTGDIFGSPGHSKPIQNVTAVLTGNSIKLVDTVSAITLSTAGTVGPNGITFANFSTTGGPLTQTLTPSGTFGPNQLVVNDVDLQGSYFGPVGLVNFINTGVIPNVSASMSGQQVILTGTNIDSIKITTTGTPNATTYMTFQNFNTLNGMLQKSYTGLDQFYIDYLQLQLADRICKKLNFAVPPTVREQLDIYRAQIIKMAEPMDLQVQKISALTRAIGVNWAQANIGKGWTTNGGY